MNDVVTTDPRGRVTEIFGELIDLPEAVRAARLDELCSGDEATRSEVESWLASYKESEVFLETPVFSPQKFIESDPVAGRQFGNYTIESEIGHGGMGTVYLVQRTDGEFEQKAALKIVRQSIAEGFIVERFKRERQILASLDHPNIARLLDGGVSATGEPYLVMEFIEGQPITAFAEELSIREKLRLFLKVCSALSYAHRNLIVHRDIKPGNILVTKEGEPKLLDFGLAKLLDEGLGLDVTETRTEFRALTPAYASPEQLKGDAITTASDVYSLGVVLYELLTGQRPFKFDGMSLEQIIRVVMTSPPPPPSSEPAAAVTRPQLKGDLDNIVFTALQQEPERRYPTVEALANDIERFLEGLPVSARPNTLRYRAGKYIRRHRWGVAASAAIVLTLLVGVVISVWQARVARQEKAKAENVSAFLEDTLKYSNPILSPLKRSMAGDVTVNEVLNEASRRLKNGEFDGDPELKVELERMIAESYFGQGKYPAAREHMGEYVALLRGLYGEDGVKYIIGSCGWADLLFAKNEMDEAEAEYRRSVPKLRVEYARGNVRPRIMANVINNFAYFRRTQGDSVEAESLFRETLDIIPHLSVEDRRSVATTRSTLASTIADQGRFGEALATAREAVDEFEARGESDTASYGFALNVLGGFLTEKGEYAEAGQRLATAETIFRGLFGVANLWLGDNLRNEATLFCSEGKYAEAVQKADQAANMYVESFGKHYDNYPTVLIAKGLSLAKMGDVRNAELILRDAADLRHAALPPAHFWVAAADGALGECLMLEGREAEAERLLRSSFDSLAASQESDSPRLALARTRLAAFYEKQGRADLAASYR